jgi:poly(U)-specific endoribonuclease
VLNRLWFENYVNYYGYSTTEWCCGFEHVFVGEAKMSGSHSRNERLGEVSGYHSWIKYYLDEKYERSVNFLGTSYGSAPVIYKNADVVTLRMKWFLKDRSGNIRARLTKNIGGFFVGFSPEYEIVAGAVLFYESVQGMLQNDRRNVEINGNKYNLVMYRNYERNQSRGQYIRSFYPEYLGSDGRPVNPPSDDPEPRVEPTLPPTNPPTVAQIKIVSALVNPAGDDVGKETITLKNVGSTTVDLNGWFLLDQNQRETSFTGSLSAGTQGTLRLSGQGIQLPNRTGSLTLYNANGRQVDAQRYTGSQIKADGRVTF